jgi:hypothetical protein
MSPYEPPPKSMPLTETFSEGEPEMSNAWYTWALGVSGVVGGVSGTVTLAKITGGGADGSLTFTNGRITAFTQPT